MAHPEHLTPPPRLLLLEGMSIMGRFWRAFGHLGERGPAHGRPVMVIPGFFASDRSTLGLQRGLARAGYRVAGWGLGTNRGAHSRMLDDIIARIEQFAPGQPVVLLGWSLVVRRHCCLRHRPSSMIGARCRASPRASDVFRSGSRNSTSSPDRFLQRRAPPPRHPPK